MGNGDTNTTTEPFDDSFYYYHDHRVGSGGGSGVFVNVNDSGVINHVASGICLESSTGSNNNTGKVLFTATQWQELERQMMIYKYIMASIPVPPHLLLPLSTQSNSTTFYFFIFFIIIISILFSIFFIPSIPVPPHLLLPLSTQSNKGGMELRFSSGSDPEPWRCRRTDGKKWRCARDVAPDQKYCERHAHKNRPRSRKHVEIQSQNTNIITTSGLNVTATSSFQHPRCSEWFMKSGGSVNESSSSQQFKQSMSLESSPRVGSKRTHIFPQNFEENNQHDSHFNYCNLQLDSAGARRQHFIDAWSKTGGGDNCSLTLSMQCSGGIDGNDDHRFDIGSEDVLKSDNNNQWLSQGSWMGSQPGGPLGEALGLGVAGTVNGPLNGPSTHGHSTSTATTTTTTTSSSCDHGGSHDHEFSFIR